MFTASTKLFVSTDSHVAPVTVMSHKHGSAAPLEHRTPRTVTVRVPVALGFSVAQLRTAVQVASTVVLSAGFIQLNNAIRTRSSFT